MIANRELAELRGISEENILEIGRIHDLIEKTNEDKESD